MTIISSPSKSTTPLQRILVVEDDEDIQAIIRFNLERANYHTEQALSGEVALSLLEDYQPHLVILDLMLPGLTGIDICLKIKQSVEFEHIPIIMVTAKGEQEDIIRGLDAGADDYISKPFHPKELLSRIRAVLRRSQPTATEPATQIQIGNLIIDPTHFECRIRDDVIYLTQSEFRILHYLALHLDKVLRRDEILSTLQSETITNKPGLMDRNIDVHIRSIRKKLRRANWIRTVHGIGYVMERQTILED